MNGEVKLVSICRMPVLFILGGTFTVENRVVDVVKDAHVVIRES